MTRDDERSGTRGASTGPAVMSSLRAPLPRGARDLLPGAARMRRRITGRLLATFERWGFEQVITPSVEYDEVIGRGLGIAQRARCVRFIEPGSGEVVTLPPDITPQIARMVATRWGGELPSDEIVRLSYATAVVRQPEARREQAEHHQAGVELIGDAAPEADAELIALCHESLWELGLRDVRIDLAHTAVAREVIAGIGLGDASMTALHGMLARKDEDGTLALLGDAGVEQPVRHAVAALCHLYGPPDVLERARTVLVCRPVARALDRLQAVLDALRTEAPEAWSRVVVDLGEVRGFDYYTGLRLRVWAPGVAEPVVGGGRYNDMLARYGVALPATGFAIDLDMLEAALAHAGITVGDGEDAPAIAVVVSPRCSAVEDARKAARREAAAAARTARASGARAWIQLAQDPDVARERALAAGATRVVYFDLADDGRTMLRSVWSRERTGWRDEESNVKHEVIV